MDRGSLLLLSRRGFALLNLFWACGLVGAVQSPGNEAYWKEQRRKREAEHQAEEHLLATQRAEAVGMVKDAAREGAAVQQQLIAMDRPAPETPPWWTGQIDKIVLGAATVLLSGLIALTLARHRREGEIRKLTGGYLSDGTEVAKFQLPDWFAPAPLIEPSDEQLEVPTFAPAESTEKSPQKVTHTKFFADAAEMLVALRAGLKVLAGTEDTAARVIVFSEMQVCVEGICAAANCWELRPAWQLSSALALLLQHLTKKPADGTPSAIRTISAVVDLLHELCVPDVRPSLILDPPPRILVVDDEPLCRRALTFALGKANLTPDTANDGTEAVALATKNPYDLIFMDINMPQLDGLAACTNLRHEKLNAETPVVFVTTLSDFAMRARTIALGRTDLLGKPFLVLEVSVKAMTMLMRKRLEVSKSARTQLATATAPLNAREAKSTLPEKLVEVAA